MILLNKKIIKQMYQRKAQQPRQYISLKSRGRRHSSLPYIFAPHHKCKIALLSPSDYRPILDFLHLADLSIFHEALYSHKKTKEGAKTVIRYIAQRERIYSVLELRQFLGFIILRKKKQSKWWNINKNDERNDIERINWDVQRTNVWFCRSKEQIQGMRGYLKRVLMRLCGQASRYGYIQGFHCIIKAMYESKMSEQESYLLGSYFLKEMKLGEYYQNRQERMRELCYILDVYVFNNLPELHEHLKKQELTAQCYAISWFLTLFSQGLPLPMLNRLWTLFIMKGWKVIIKFSVALLCLFQRQILAKSQGQLPQFLGSLQSKLMFSKEPILWQLYISIKVTNSMVAYLSRKMKVLEYDREVSISQLKQMREAKRYNTLFEGNQNEIFPTHFSVGICCQKVEPSRSFPYCGNQ